jgi:hypothetical protein
MLVAGDVTVERAAVVSRIERWLFTCPLWTLALTVFGAAYLRFGYGTTSGMDASVRLARDPFTNNQPFPWLYQSPLGPVLAWLARVDNSTELVRFHAVVSIGALIGVAYVIRRHAGHIAARLYLLAFLASYRVWATTRDSGGVVDVVTVAGLSLAMVIVSPFAGFAVGAMIGANHFEQGIFALAIVALLRRRILRDQAPIVALFAGLFAGKAVAYGYLFAFDLPRNGRLGFILDFGIDNIIRGWMDRDVFVPMVWSSLHVAWVAVIWMLYKMNRDDRTIVAAAFLLATVPVLLTYDLTRVYSILTWPIVMLTCIWFGARADLTVRRGALLLAAAGLIVPITTVSGSGFVAWFAEQYA